MTDEQFLQDLAELLEIENELTPESDLREIEEYDSLAIMGLVAYADQHFGRKLRGADFTSVTTVKSLMDLLGREFFE